MGGPRTYNVLSALMSKEGIKQEGLQKERVALEREGAICDPGKCGAGSRSQRPELAGLRPGRQGEVRLSGVFESCSERLGQAQQFEGPTLSCLTPLSLGEIGDAPKLAGLPRLLEPRPGTCLEDFWWVGPRCPAPSASLGPMSHEPHERGRRPETAVHAGSGLRGERKEGGRRGPSARGRRLGLRAPSPAPAVA